MINMKEECTIKETTIELLEIAETNLLISFYGLEPDQITKQSKPEVNPIDWIYGHCISHMDFIYGELCQGSRLLPSEVGKLVSYGASKETIAKGLPISFKELVEYGLKITERTYKYLQNLPEATAQAYIQALFDEDSETAHGYLSTDLQAECEPGDLEPWWVRNADSASFDEVHNDGSHAEIELRLLSNEYDLGIFPFDSYDYSRETELELDRVDGEWVITDATWPLAGCTWR